MTRKKLIPQLLKHYKKVFRDVKKKRLIADIKHLLRVTETDFGICNCAQNHFNVDIYGRKWVKKYGNYWGELPVYVYTKKEILSCLQIRIDNLTKELELINANNIVNN